MLVLERVNNIIDYSVNAGSSIAETVATQPGTLGTTLELATKVIKTVDYYHDHTHCPELVEGMKDVLSFISFYSLYRNIIFLINPFNVKNIDRKVVDTSLLNLIKKESKPGQKLIELETVKVLIDSLLKNNYRTKNEFKKDLTASLQKSFSSEKADRIVQNLTVAITPRPFSSIAKALCAATLNLKSAAGSLEHFKILDLAHLSAKIGSKAPIFLIIIKGALDVAGKTLIVFGVIGIAQAVHALIKAQKIINSQASTEEKMKAYINRKKALWDIASGTTLLVSMTVPMVFVVSTPVVLILGIVANGTSLVKVFAKPS